MKKAKITAILVLALCLIVCPAKVSEAEPMGTAWTYQGRLIDANYPADGLYDFEFRLYDSNDPCTGVQLGDTIDVSGLDVIDGQFVVELDFGSDVFDGKAVWLETRIVRSPLGSEPAGLRPLIEVTPVPYALQPLRAHPLQRHLGTLAYLATRKEQSSATQGTRPTAGALYDPSPQCAHHSIAQTASPV